MTQIGDPRLIPHRGVVEQGDLYWVGPDEARSSVPGSPHPHVVVQDDLFNRSRINTVIVCALTSDLRRATEPGNVLLDAGEGALEKQSVIVVSQISSLDRTQLGARIGALSIGRVEQVLAGIRFQQAAYFNR